MTKPLTPNWNDYESLFYDDGKYNLDSWHVPFPGYINNQKYPFTFCNVFTVGETNKWVMGDEEKTFKENLLKTPPDWKYRNKSITYNANSNGYRTYEWSNVDWKNAIVIFGDSCTFGIGVDEDETINYFLEKYTGRQVINLGYPSGSNNLILNNCAAMIKHFGIPYGVVINWSTLNRFRYFTKSQYHEAGPWNKHTPQFSQDIDGVDLEKLWGLTFYDPTNELAINYYLSTYADAMFEGKTNYIKISYFASSAHCTRSDATFKIINTARDLVHPGVESSIEIAEYINNKLRK